MTPEKRLVEALLKNIEAQIRPVQGDPGVSGPGSGNAGGQEQIGAQRLGHVRRVLHRVVECHLVHTVKVLMAGELVEVQSECWLVGVHCAKAAGGAFEMDTHIRINGGGVPDRGADIGSGIGAQFDQVGRGDFDAKVRNGTGGEEPLRLVAFESGSVGQVDCVQEDSEAQHPARGGRDFPA